MADDTKSSSFNIEAPNGKTYKVTAPPGTTKEQAEQYFREQHSDLYSDSGSSSSSDSDLGPDPGVVNDFFRTLNQSWLLDPIEGGAQLAASIPVVGPALQSAYNLTPGSAATTRFLEDYKNRATRNDWQRAMRVPADVFNPLMLGLGPESALAAKGTQIAPRIAAKWKALPPIPRAAAASGIGATLTPSEKQPTFGEEVQKATLGTLGGATIGKVAGRAEARTAAEAAAERTRGHVEASKKYDEAGDKYRADVQQAHEDHQAALAKHEKDYRSAVTAAQTQATQAAKEAQEAVPGQTMRQFWKEALAPIGEEANA
ncbi:MAG TPA: hypothetical protein VF742_02220, partial [Terracidiphilus sp.]